MSLLLDENEAIYAFSTVSLGITTCLPFFAPVVVFGRGPLVATDLYSCYCGAGPPSVDCLKLCLVSTRDDYFEFRIGWFRRFDGNYRSSCKFDSCYEAWKMSGFRSSDTEGDGSFSISSCSFRTLCRNDYSSLRLISRASIRSLVFWSYLKVYYSTNALSFCWT